jgi:membrane-associated protein
MGKSYYFARFLPIFRTFAPIVAGIVTMDKKFMYYNVISSFLWSFTLIFAGHYLYGFLLDSYQIDLKNHIELIILGLVILTLSPVLPSLLKKARNLRIKK